MKSAPLRGDTVLQLLLQITRIMLAWVGGLLGFKRQAGSGPEHFQGKEWLVRAI